MSTLKTFYPVRESTAGHKNMKVLLVKSFRAKSEDTTTFLAFD
jgi:hypothetical protein